MVAAEAAMVAKRLDVRLANQISLLQMALSAQPNMNVKASGTKRVQKELSKLLKDMLDGQ